MNTKEEKLYPLKFHPIFKERLWGGSKLRDVLEKEMHGEGIGESWELSTVPGEISVVSEGVLKETSLQELIKSYKGDLVGEKVYSEFGEMFPLLIKFIDAKLDLSVQLHPNDELAQKRHDSFGKTEMWYVMEADEDAKLIVGFNKDTTKEEYEQHLKHNTLSELLNFEQVTEGDTFFINTGKIHAIGAGTLLAEIQQTSDITYRVYDWNRKDKDGKTRELHTELALDAIDYEKKDDFKIKYDHNHNITNDMVRCDYFVTNYLNLDSDMNFDHSDKDSFVIYICVAGEGSIVTEHGKTSIKKGETILIPAALKQGTIETASATFLEVHI